MDGGGKAAKGKGRGEEARSLRGCRAAGFSSLLWRAGTRARTCAASCALSCYKRIRMGIYE